MVVVQARILQHSEVAQAEVGARDKGRKGVVGIERKGRRDVLTTNGDVGTTQVRTADEMESKPGIDITRGIEITGGGTMTEMEGRIVAAGVEVQQGVSASEIAQTGNGTIDEMSEMGPKGEMASRIEIVDGMIDPVYFLSDKSLYKYNCMHLHHHWTLAYS